MGMGKRGTHVVYIALGSNQGDRLEKLRAAVKALQPEVMPLDNSRIYETPPWGYTDQPAFLNQVIRAETSLTPQGLLEYLKEIEVQVGRRPTFRYGPRVIDLDILFYDELVHQSVDLTIPHPSLPERAFVLLPLADLAPELRHPVLEKTVKELLGEVSSEGISIYAAGKDVENE